MNEGQTKKKKWLNNEMESQKSFNENANEIKKKF